MRSRRCQQRVGAVVSSLARLEEDWGVKTWLTLAFIYFLHPAPRSRGTTMPYECGPCLVRTTVSENLVVHDIGAFGYLPELGENDWHRQLSRVGAGVCLVMPF